LFYREFSGFSGGIEIVRGNVPVVFHSAEKDFRVCIDAAVVDVDAVRYAICLFPGSCIRAAGDFRQW
jgi:hypothetical protein